MIFEEMKQALKSLNIAPTSVRSSIFVGSSRAHA
jgi:hypothetical protein